MKTKIKIAVIVLMGISLRVSAQKVISLEGENDPNFVNKDGNVGIGTTNPEAMLEINDARPVIRLKHTKDGTPAYGWLEFNDVNSRMGYIGFGSSKTNHLYLMNDAGGNILIPKGNVGIGTTSPGTNLEINSSSPIIGLKHTKDGIGAYGWLEFNDVNSRMGYVGFGSSKTNHLYIMNDAGGNTLIPKGNVGIGTTTTGGHRFAVEGSIGAREIKVEASGWSDFVFYNDYNLPTLREVEDHIKENGHLKDIPSAKEIENNGFFLGEMDAKLLQKIEELTLYTIEQEKKIKSLEKQNSKIGKLEKENRLLKSLLDRVSAIEEKLESIN